MWAIPNWINPKWDLYSTKRRRTDNSINSDDRNDIENVDDIDDTDDVDDRSGIDDDRSPKRKHDCNLTHPLHSRNRSRSQALKILLPKHLLAHAQKFSDIKTTQPCLYRIVALIQVTELPTSTQASAVFGAT